MSVPMGPPTERPFRLNVHVIPHEGGDNLRIPPSRKFVQLTERYKTLQELCDQISERHKSQYGRDLNIKKCQEVSGCDIDLSYAIGDVFDDHAILRVIEGSEFIRADSLFPESSLRPKRRHSLDASADDLPPTKRQRLLHPDQPVRSLERDFEDDAITLVNGEASAKIPDSQPSGMTTAEQVHAQENSQAFSQAGLGSPFNMPNATVISPQLPQSNRALSSELLDDISRTGQHVRPSVQPEHSLRRRDNSISTAITTPLMEPMVPNTPDGRNFSNVLRSFGRKSSNIERNSRERHTRTDVYDDIETDTEAHSLSAQKRKEAEEERKRLERQRQEEAREEEKKLKEAEKERQEQERLAEHERQAELQKRQADEKRLTEQSREAEAKRAKELAEKEKSTQKVTRSKSQRNVTSRQGSAADSTAESQASAAAVEAASALVKATKARTERAIAEAGKFPKCPSKGENIWTAEEDDVLMQARIGNKLAWDSVREVYLPHKTVEMLKRRNRTLTEFRKRMLASGQVQPSTQTELPRLPEPHYRRKPSTETEHPTLPPAPKYTPGFSRHESSTAPIPSNGTVLSSLPAATASSPSTKDVGIESQMPLPSKAKQAFGAAKQSTPTSGQRSSTSVASKSLSSTAPIPSNGTVLPSLPAAAAISPPSTSDVGIESQMPLPPKAKRAFGAVKQSTPTSGQRSSTSVASKSLISPEARKETPIPAPKPKFPSTPQTVSKPSASSGKGGGSLKQTRLVSPRLSITDVKITAKGATPRGKSPSRLTAKPPIKPQSSSKKQAKLLPETGSSQDKDPANGSANSNLEPEESENHPSDPQEGSGRDSDNADREDAEDVAKVSGAHSTRPEAGKEKKVAEKPKTSTQYSQREESRSPVSFMVRPASPSVANSQDEDSVASSPPIVQDETDEEEDENEDEEADEDEDDESTESEDDHLDQIKGTGASKDGTLPITHGQLEQELDEQLQSQIRRDSSQLNDEARRSTQRQIRGHSHSSQLPSLNAMSQKVLQPKKSKLESAKEESSEESDSASESESDDDSDSSSEDDSDDDATNSKNPGKDSRSAGADLASKANKKGISFEKLIAKKK